MELNLAGKVAVVTGAGKGIGMATTQALAGEGAHVVAGSLTTDTLDGLKGVTPVAVDLTGPDGPAQLIRRAAEEHGRIDVLVNNVGAVRMRTEGLFGTRDEDFAWAMKKFICIAQAKSSSVVPNNPSVRMRTAPTLLTSTSMRPCSSDACRTSCAGPSGPVRTTATAVTP